MISRKLNCFILSLAMLWACGKKSSGDSGGGQGETNKTGSSGSASAASALLGKLFLGSTSFPAEGYWIVVTDHQNKSAKTAKVTSEGNFLVPVSWFNNDTIYALYVLSADQYYIGAVDMSVETSGTQAGFRYNGGAGYDLGNLIVKYEADGTISENQSELANSIGGGFSAVSGDYDIDQLSRPSGFNDLYLEHRLAVLDPSTLLNGFYRKAINPLVYGQGLTQFSKAYLGVESSSENTIKSVAVEGASGWLKSAKITAKDSDGPYESTLWSADSFTFKKGSANLHEADIYLGSFPNGRESAILKVSLMEGGSFFYPLKIAQLISMPPLLKDLGQKGEFPTAVDYSSPTAQNGLSIPFCLEGGDVSLVVTPPKDGGGDFFTVETLGKVTVALDYYYQENAVDTLIVPAATDYSSSYQSDNDDTSSQDMSRKWEVSNHRLTYTLNAESLGGATSHTLTVPEGVLINTLSSSTNLIKKIRFRLNYEGAGLKAGSVIWFKYCS